MSLPTFGIFCLFFVVVFITFLYSNQDLSINTWYLIMVLICISLMINEDNIFLMFVGLWILSFMEFLISLAHFSILVSDFFLLSYKSSLYIPDKSPLSYMCVIDPISCSISFHSSNYVF